MLIRSTWSCRPGIQGGTEPAGAKRIGALERYAWRMLWAVRNGNVFRAREPVFQTFGKTIFQTAEIVGAILDARQLGETSRMNSLATDRTATSARLRWITLGRM